MLSGKKSFGEKKARTIEEIEELPDGWLDESMPDEATQHMLVTYQHLRPDFRDELARYAQYLLSKQGGEIPGDDGPRLLPPPLRPKPN